MNRRLDSRVALLLLMAVFAITPGPVLAVDFAKLYATVSPSVVTVHTRTITLSKKGMGMVPGVGTGFLLEPDLVMTAAHVVDGVDLIKVKFSDNSTFDATVVSSVKGSDVALIKLREANPNVSPVTLGDSSATAIGAPVFVVGAPYGMEQTLSVGHLSGRLHRGKTEAGTPIDFLQTDTAINPGNSGGPMFNERGEVIGVVSFILTKSGGFNGIGFAGAINSARKALQESSEYIAGFKGVQLSKVQSRALSVPADGILVQNIVKGSLADDLGLKAGKMTAQIGGEEMLLGGDVILSIDCLACADNKGYVASRSIARKISLQQPLQVTVYRDRELVTLTSEKTITAELANTSPATAEIAGLSMLARTGPVIP